MTTATAETPTPRAANPIRIEKSDRLPIARIHPSKTNPRTHFDDAYIKDDLAVSIREKGIIQPLVVRPHPKKDDDVEIVAGECRWRAAKIVGLDLLPVIIREYSDEEVLEIQIEENTHRKDLTPLEEGAAYRRLITMNPDKHSAATIAARIGKSPTYVWDYLKLLDLIPEAKTILESERMMVGHAILIARLKPVDQARAIAVDDGMANGMYRPESGLWRRDSGFDFDEDAPANKGKKPGKYDEVKACSVRELEAWIKNHVRFDVEHAAKAQPLAFEETAVVVQQATEQPGRGKKVIPITYAYRVADDARDGNERTYGSESWERADGKEKSKTCEFSVLGVVVAGDGQGQTLQVCVSRDKCLVHFGDVVRAKQKAAKLREAGKPKAAARGEAAAAQLEVKKREAQRRKEERWKYFRPAITKAVHAAASKLPATLPKAVFKKMLSANRLPPSTTSVQLPKVLMLKALESVFASWASSYNEPNMVAWAKTLGVDVKACEPKKDAAAPAKKGAA